MANTPNDLTDAEINDLVENERLPMSAEGRKYFELGKTMLGLLVPPETIFARPATRTTLVFEPAPYGRGMGWLCYDSNVYDGPESDIGCGATKEDALTDYEERLEAARAREAMVNRRPFVAIATDQFEPTDYKPSPMSYDDEPGDEA